MKKIEELQKVTFHLEVRQFDNITDIPDHLVPDFADIGKNLIQRLGERIQNLRSIKVSKGLTLEKLKLICTSEQMKSRYSFAISSIKTYLFQIDICIDRLL